MVQIEGILGYCARLVVLNTILILMLYTMHNATLVRGSRQESYLSTFPSKIATLTTDGECTSEMGW